MDVLHEKRRMVVCHARLVALSRMTEKNPVRPGSTGRWERVAITSIGPRLNVSILMGFPQNVAHYPYKTCTQTSTVQPTDARSRVTRASPSAFRLRFPFRAVPCKCARQNLPNPGRAAAHRTHPSPSVSRKHPWRREEERVARATR
jgi:hypothetical protein